MRRSVFLFAAGKPSFVYRIVSDRMVFGIDVDTDFDSPFASDAKASVFTKPSIFACGDCHRIGDFGVYGAYGHADWQADGTLCNAGCLFCVSCGDRFAVFAVRHCGKGDLCQKISQSALTGGCRMKKKIGFVSLEPSLAQWLVEKIKTAPASVSGKQEFSDAICALIHNESTSLMIELSESGQSDVFFDVIQCGGLSIDAKTRRVVRDGEEIFLTPKEFDILYFLARNRGEVFTKEQIYQAVWVGEYLFDDSNIMAFIRKLRKKIEPNPDAPEYILTIWGIGYKMNDRNQ